MRIKVNNGRNRNKQKVRINPETILKYLIGNDDDVDTLIMCRSSEIELTATDKDLYEALGSIKQYDHIKLNKLVKLLEVVDIVSVGGEKPVLKDERVDELRKRALR